MRVLFVEPPKDAWFVMGEYLPPPLGILQLAAYLESKNKNIEIEVLDCQAKQLGWKKLEKYIESFQPDVVVPSSLATCNAYTVVRTLEFAKKVNPNILTVAGGQHFSATARESLEKNGAGRGFGPLSLIFRNYYAHSEFFVKKQRQKEKLTVFNFSSRGRIRRISDGD